MPPDATANPPSAAELVDVDLHGVSVKLPKVDADKVIAGRQSAKDEQRKLAERLGALEAEKKAVEDAKRKAEEDKALADAAKAGEIDKIKQIGEQRVARIAERYRDTRLEAAVAKHPAVIAEAAGDIAAQLRQSCRFDVDRDMVEVIDAAGKPRVDAEGKPLGVDALIAEYLNARPWFRKPSNTPGSGAAGKGGSATGAVKTAAEIEAMGAIARAQFFQSGGTQSG